MMDTLRRTGVTKLKVADENIIELHLAVKNNTTKLGIRAENFRKIIIRRIYERQIKTIPRRRI